MITLTSALLTALGRRITEPGLFIELGFDSATLRVTDRGTRTWNSLTWSTLSVAISGYSVDESIVTRCALTIDDANLAIAADAVLPENTGRPVRIWYFDRAATATADPVLLFDGAMDTAEGGHSRQLTLSCSIVDKTLPVGMLANLMPAYMFAQEGRVLTWGRGRVPLERRGEYR